MDADYIVAIPSYKRADLCLVKTLTMLKINNILPTNIFVYVANDEEYCEYTSKLDSSLYNKIVIGKKGLVQQRQFIMNQWEMNKHIVFFDDDVESIDLSLGALPPCPRLQAELGGTAPALDYFIKYAFNECMRLNAYIWGVYPVYNPFFRKSRKEMTTCLNYIVGAFYGLINRPNNTNLMLDLTAENSQKEDVERTLKYFIEDGIVLRFNKIGFITKYYGKSGGLGTFKERIQPMLEASERLKKTYGDYGNIKIRKNGMAEFRLKKQGAKPHQSNSGLLL